MKNAFQTWKRGAASEGSPPPPPRAQEVSGGGSEGGMKNAFQTWKQGAAAGEGTARDVPSGESSSDVTEANVDGGFDIS